MTKIDLRRFGFKCNVEVHGTIKSSWSGGKRLVFLFGESHRDREMKRLNVANACILCDLGIVGCAGTEIPLDEIGVLSVEDVQRRSEQLLNDRKTDGAVITYLSEQQPSWYGIFEFANTLKILRPSLPIKCMEDPILREQMNPISDAYCKWELGAAPHPSPEYPNMGDHPHNFKRENAMIDNLLALWDETTPNLAAILNTGWGHCERIGNDLRERGIQYIHISIPESATPFWSTYIGAPRGG